MGNGLQDVFQISALGADTQIVQDGIALLVSKLGWLALLLQGFTDGTQILITGTRRGLVLPVIRSANRYTYIISS